MRTFLHYVLLVPRALFVLAFFWPLCVTILPYELITKKKVFPGPTGAASMIVTALLCFVVMVVFYAALAGWYFGIKPTLG